VDEKSKELHADPAARPAPRRRCRRESRLLRDTRDDGRAMTTAIGRVRAPELRGAGGWINTDIALSLREGRGRDLLLDLAASSEVLIENFRPGTLERWDLGYATLKASNPDIVLVRVSGYGQDGPYRDKAGFGTPAAAMGGLTYITGYPDRPPISVPIALADYLAFDYVPAPRTMLSGVRKLPGGHYATLTTDEIEVRPYWDSDI